MPENVLTFPPRRPVRSPGVVFAVTSRRTTCPHCMVPVGNPPALALHVVAMHRVTIPEAVEIARERS